MNKPYLNALAASAYVSLVATFFFYGGKLFGPVDTVIAPILMLSLLVFSVALMGYFFVYQPIRLLVEGKQKEAVTFFFSTIAFFAGIIGVLVLIGLLLA